MSKEVHHQPGKSRGQDRQDISAIDASPWMLTVDNLLEQFLDATQTSHEIGSLVRQEDRLVLVAVG